MTIEQEMFDYLVSKGLPENSAAGVLANIYRESAYHANNLQYSGNTALGLSNEEFVQKLNSGEYTRSKFIIDKYGFGLCQWTYPTRKETFYDYIIRHKVSFDDWKAQLDFMLAELKQPYYAALNEQLYNSGDWCGVIAKSFMLQYEKPANMTEENQIIRVNLAYDILNRCCLKAKCDKLENAVRLIGKAVAEINEILKGVV